MMQDKDLNTQAAEYKADKEKKKRNASDLNAMIREKQVKKEQGRYPMTEEKLK